MLSAEKERPRNRPVDAVIIGAGHRAVLYASYAERHPEEMRIVGVVDPSEVRRNQTAAKFGIPDNAVFPSVENLVSLEHTIADVAINGTMDAQHVETTIPLLKAGYDVLLEKPIGTSAEELIELLDCSRCYGRTVMVCHVLRYAPFYAEIRKRVMEGAVGEILNIQTAEHVSYHHMAMGFVRGKWNSKDKCKSSMLMAKCCHDLDLLSWIKGDVVPERVSSFGALSYFRPDRAPAGAGTRCLVDCSIEHSCPYSAKKHYIEQGLWSSYVWPHSHLGIIPTPEEQLESLRTDNPYGRCAWKCDNDVVDHQSVVVQFADGSTATHNLVGGASRPSRYIHIIGTKGEIEGVLENGSFVIRRPDPRPGHEYLEEPVELNVSNDMHGGGDLRLVEDFIRVIRGETPSISSTTLERSIYGHLIGFAADTAMEGRQIVNIQRL